VRERGGRTALHLAADNGHDKIVARLLAHNPALIDAIDSNNMTALHFAARDGHESTAMQLLSHSPGLIDMKAGSRNTDTALHLAASGGHVKVVAELLARRPSFLADEDWRGQTPLFCAASQGHQEVVDLLPLTTDQVLCLHTILIVCFSMFPHQVHRRNSDGNTLLHLFIGGEGPLRPALIERIWEMNPDALFVANAHGVAL